MIRKIKICLKLLTGASSAAAMNALDDLSLLQLRFRDSADAVGSEVGVARLDASQAAEILVAGLLPLGYQGSVSDALFQAVFVEFARNNFASVEHVVDVPRLLVVDLKNRPKRLVNSFSFMWLSLGCKNPKIKTFKKFYFIFLFYLLASFVPCSPTSPRWGPNLLAGASCFGEL